MKILLKGHEYKYEIEHMARLFFFEERIEFVDTEYKDMDLLYIESILEDRNGILTSVTRIINCGEEYSHRVESRYDSSISGLNYIKKSKRVLKLSFYYAAKMISKVQVPWGILTGIRPSKVARDLMERTGDIGEVKKILAYEYAVSNKKIELSIEVARNEAKVLKNTLDNNVSLYIGIPFCPTRCLYCSFISNSLHTTQRFVEPYLDALTKEILYSKEVIQKMGWDIENIYIGGGTPTALTPDQLDRLLDSVCSDIKFDTVKEFTIEAGRPDTITRGKLQIIKQYPVDRISINPQTMNRDTLKLIGRDHSPEDILNAFQMARDLGFGDINMDIIAGLPDESVEMYKDTLIRVQSLNPENITVHTMSIKRGSRLDEKIDQYSMTRATAVNDMLDFTQGFMRDNGMQPYYMYRQKNILGNLENIGYCKPGYEGIYNIQMMQETQSIIGVGSGGVTKMVDISKNKIDRIFNVKDVKTYIERIDEMMMRKNGIYDYFK